MHYRNATVDDIPALLRLYKKVAETSGGIARQSDEVTTDYVTGFVNHSLADGLIIVLENDAEYQRWKIDRRNATRIVRDRRAQAAVREQLQALRQQTAQRVGPQDAEKVTTHKTPGASPAVNSTSVSSAAARMEPLRPV